MFRILAALCVVVGLGGAVFFFTQDRTNWTTVTAPQSFVFGDVVLRVVETGAVADLDALAADPFLGGLFTSMDQALRTETARGYGLFDPETQMLDLYVGGTVTQATYDADTPMASAMIEGSGPIEVHWDHRGLSANIIAPVMMFGAPSEWAFHMPLVAADDVSAQTTAQENIIAQAIADKAEWRAKALAFAEKHADKRTYDGPVRDVWLAGWQATLSYPENARFVPETSVVGGRVILPDNQVVQISGYSSEDAESRVADYKSRYAALSDDEKLILEDTDALFIAVQYNALVNIVVKVPLDHVTYTVSAELQYWDDIGTVVAMAESLAPRPLGPPNFDPLAISREDARIAMGLPTFKIGREDDPDPTSSVRNDLEVMLRDQHLMSYASSWVNRESNFWAYRTDGEYGSVFWAQFECFPILDAPETASALHDIYIARDRFPSKLTDSDVLLMDYFESGKFASNRPFDGADEVAAPEFAPAWFVDTPSYAFGAYGPYYMAYRVDQVGDVSIFCATHDVDPWLAWMKMDLHGDVQRPDPVKLSPEVRAQFAAYPEARAFGPGYFLIGVPFTDLKSYLIAADGTVLIPERLRSWDWHEETQTITAEDDTDKAGLYLPDGTQLLPHAYEDIDTWPNLAPNVMRLRDASEDLFYDISQRSFVPDPTQ